jgi:hypothetical protein
MESMALTKFTEEGIRQQREALAGLLRDRAQHTAQRDTFRATQIDKLGSARSDKAQRLERDEAVHAALLKRKVRPGCDRLGDEAKELEAPGRRARMWGKMDRVLDGHTSRKSRSKGHGAA